MKKFLVLVLLTVLSGAALAQAPVTNVPKIGYTNLDYILGLLPKTREIESQLQTYEKQLQAQLEGKINDYKKKRDEYDKGVAAGILLPAVKEDKEKELIALETSIREFEEKAQNELQKKQVALLEPVLDTIQKAIERVADRNGYSYIFSTHADFGGSAIILYARQKEDDISNLILKELGVTPPAPGTTPKPTGNPTNGTTVPKTGTTPR